jgi:hypothetical protein
LWQFAFGAKEERELAQDALRCLPGLLQKLPQELASTDSDRRMIAADWLGRLRNPAAIEPLIAAAKREEKLETRHAMLIALELLDAPLDTFLDRSALQREAASGLAGGIPPELEWFPFPRLPPVHWSDTNQPVAPEIVQWWVIAGFKRKDPQPGLLVRRFCAQLVPAERLSLGQFVLDTWVAQEAYTRKGPVALTCKGILALAGACCGGQAAATAGRYLAKWPRKRAGQCRALVQMLAWVDHPAAMQLLLAVSSRFRPATVQDEARQLSMALAERKHWTLEQMADRAIPCAGLDEKGELQLSYGVRGFTARLDAQLQLSLVDSAGKPLKTLPAPRKADDAALAQEARKTFSAATKELKSILQIQRQRLYEAMCVQRGWSFEDWDLCLHRHPVMRHLCQRLVWAAVREGESALCFRSLADGSLTDAHDNAVRLQSGHRISLAHQTGLPAEACRDWEQHLADYEVQPLFPQFGLPSPSLSPGQPQQTDLGDFKGYLIDAFTLRGKAGGLGYNRGLALDGGVFYEYLKPFPSLGINAVIAFTGNAMPEQNRKVALTELYFSPVNDPENPLSERQTRIPLAEVPPHLLCECWNHLRAIAAGGPGFDPDWEKKVTP